MLTFLQDSHATIKFIYPFFFAQTKVLIPDVVKSATEPNFLPNTRRFCTVPPASFAPLRDL